MAAERIGQAWADIWEAGVWAAGVWEPVGAVISTAPVNPRVTIRPLVRCTPRIAPLLSVSPTISQ
jgi:hypothetical protein